MRQITKQTKEGRFEVTAAVLLKIQGFWMLCCVFSDCFTLNLKALRFIGTSGIIHQATQCYSQEDMNLECKRSWKVLDELLAQFAGVVAVTVTMR
jgi:hypothetical protein